MNPITLDFPDQFETERLLIRAPEMKDARELVAAIRESHAELSPWMEWADENYDLAAAKTHLIDAHDTREVGQAYVFFLFEKASERFVGSVALQSIEPSVPRFEIGFWLRSNACGQGYMTEAILTLFELAVEFLDAVRVEIQCDARNEKSASVALRAGLALEARLRYDRRDRRGRLSDTLIFARIREENQ